MTVTKATIAKPSSVAEKTTGTKADTILVSKQTLDSWRPPGFQREPKVNDKVKAVSAGIKAEGGIIPGVIHLAVVGGVVYLLDGQHRKIGALMTELPEFLCNVVWHFCEDMAEAGREFRKLNSHLVTPKANDFLRAMEGSCLALRTIRARCPFVGYDMVRRNTTSAPLVSMSSTIRAWFGSLPEVPVASGPSALDRLDQLTEEATNQLTGFLSACLRAWGRDVQYRVLWAALNFTVCAWLYRRTVLSQYSSKALRLTEEQFAQCMEALSAHDDYLGWLVNRHLTEQHRAPAYNRLKRIFAARLMVGGVRKPMFPDPAWANG